MGTITYLVPISMGRLAVVAWATIEKTLTQPEDRFTSIGLSKANVQTWLNDHSGLISYINEKVDTAGPQDPSEGVILGQSIPFSGDVSPWPDVVAAANLALSLNTSGAIDQLPVDASPVKLYMGHLETQPASLPLTAGQVVKLLRT